MDLSVSTTSAAALTVSEQKITLQPVTGAAAQTLQAASAGPAAVYYPSEAAQQLGLSMEAVETWIGREQSADFPQKAAAHKVAHASLKTAFEDFKANLASTFPAIADKKFGFTVQADGSLKALNSGGQLSAADLAHLNTLLNGSADLKSAAAAYRDAAIEVVNADSPWSGSYLGGYSLTQDNFAKTIDLGALFVPKGPVPTKESIQGLFFTQLYTKGEKMTQQMETVMLASRN